MSNFDITQHFKSIRVLDNGHVHLFDGMVQDPLLKIVNAARVSFQKESTEISERDIKLINYLREHEHSSCFRHSFFSFRVKAPLCVFRQWWKYQIGSEWLEDEGIGVIRIPETNWNEASGRYVEFEPEFYIPEVIRVQSKNNKQGSDGKLESVNGEDPVAFFKRSCERGYADYKALVDAGGAKEQARMLLNPNIYSECVWTCSLQTLLYFMHQRLKPDAQFEIRQYAIAIKDLVLPMIGAADITY